ncbi:TusE/DsrC/DsvC family sulfur relay protein [Marinospirillum alkaliphilum]|uniref:Sulfurtransferase n=1 Tax=Marinospirillum alkaliphilum DSM 21637 TaxID=1122209 RepID=A0A1K1TU68_9GAMM|nr:TusE/DsrC/DsvC family sulfur relay protein [Marinospirillum alkaliphilum]SFX04329.1 tRNA 2-thiouridine synthesizing protein E [Marinospirillum alkaliphilum DSM 21637]
MSSVGDQLPDLPQLDPEGHLQNLADWTPEVAARLAALDDRELTPAHHEILTLLRQFHQEFQLSPAMRPLVKYLRQHLGADKASSIYLMQLFGESPARIAARYAGLPKPDNCL